MASNVDSRDQSVTSDDRETVKTNYRGVSPTPEDCECRKSNRNLRISVASLGPRRKLHPLAMGPNPGYRRDYAAKYRAMQNGMRSNLSEVNQRVMSAKVLKEKQLQNELSETQMRMNELVHENRLLKNVQKRQEGALRKYEGNKAELPQLIRTHHEEMRTLKSNNKQLKIQLREISVRLKERENEIETLKENNLKLKKLNEDKNLLERDELQKKLIDSQKVMHEQEEKIQMLSRKMLLESKNYRHQLNLEVGKHKDTERELSSALSIITKLESQLLAREKNLLQSGTIPKLLTKTKSAKSVSNKTDFSKPKECEISKEDVGTDILGEIRAQTDGGCLTTLDKGEENSVLSDPLFLEKVLEVETKTEEKMELSADKLVTNGRLSVHVSSTNAKADPLVEAKLVNKKLSENIKAEIGANDDINSTVPLNKKRINSLYEEIRNNVSKIEKNIDEKLNEVKGHVNANRDGERNENIKHETKIIRVGDVLRSVSKRKLDENVDMESKLNSTDKAKVHENQSREDQRLHTMNKTWNDIKEKVRRERQNAEETIKNLGGNKSEEFSSSGSDLDESEFPMEPKSNSMKSLKPIVKQPTHKARIQKLTEDKLIIGELKKADDMARKLKTESQKFQKKLDTTRSGDKDLGGKKNCLEIISGEEGEEKETKPKINFRTESFQSSDILDNFQTEHQKQNLLKALKAIDVGKDPDESSDDSEYGFNYDKINHKLYTHDKSTGNSGTSNCKSKTELMKELFGK